MTAKGPKRTIWVMEMFYIIAVAITRVKANIKTQEGIYLKWVHFVVGKSYLDKVDFKEHYPGTNCSV